MKKKPESSAYINEQRRQYSLYVMRQRALPSITDGLKSSGRRVLWTARDGKKVKAATLAGATLPIHPHANPDDTVNTLAANYGNNIPFLTGGSAFGTLIAQKEFAATRYTEVRTSRFTNEVLFRDIEIIPMQENYDGTLMEPTHFLPLVPTVLLNPTDGIAVGFATNILPRDLGDIILAQITHLKGGKRISEPIPVFHPLNCASHEYLETPTGIAYYFNGTIERKDTSSVIIKSLPFTQTHEKVIAKLNDLMESEILIDYTDGSKDEIHIELKFKRGYLKDIDDADLLKMLGLTVREIENLTMLDFTGQAVMKLTPVETIRQFTDWRLTWYIKRYERLRDMLKVDLQRYYDIRCAIKNKVGTIATKTDSRTELKEVLETLGIVNLDYIAELPVYRFTEEERLKNEKRIQEGEAQLKEYMNLLASEDLRKKVYVSELQEVLVKYNKGHYSE